MALTNSEFIVDGMTCDGCVSAIKRALSAIDGVDNVDVNLSNGAVKISYDPARVGQSSLLDAIRSAGYDVN